MPLLTLVNHPPVTDPGLRRAVAGELTDHTERLLGKQRPLTALAWLAAPTDWFVGAQSLDEDGAGAPLRTFSLEIRITAGSNRVDEKAAWIAAAWETLSRALPGPVAPASYVCITELPASDWGWGGRTQQARRTTS